MWLGIARTPAGSAVASARRLRLKPDAPLDLSPDKSLETELDRTLDKPATCTFLAKEIAKKAAERARKPAILHTSSAQVALPDAIAGDGNLGRPRQGVGCWQNMANSFPVGFLAQATPSVHAPR